MSWRRYFTPVNINGQMSPLGGMPSIGSGSKTNYSSYLPDVYTGSPNRIERYLQYDTMDMDSEVNAALDIIAEFSTQKSRENNTPFHIFFRDKATSVEVKLLGDYLRKWSDLQQLETRIFKIFRNTCKYGDTFFIRDPETKKWFYLDPGKLVKIIVNESDGKKPEQYVIRDLNPNFMHLVVTQINPSNQNTQPGGTAYVSGGAGARGMTGAFPQQSGTRFSIAQNEMAIEAKHIVHISLSEGLDNNYPFGNSLLESVFKVYKQKELLEDAIIIYRVQRAPERRVFYIDVGNMPSHMAMSFVERVKNEIHQRRIPSSTGGSTVIDNSYNPMSINEDYFFPQTAEGRGSKVETLPGGTNLGEIDDLRYFTNKLFRALRIPSSYLPTGADDSASTFNDGKVGTAYIQELRFNKYLERLQSLMEEEIDKEFKLYLFQNGIVIDDSIFKLKFNPPQNFAAYRLSELDTARVQTFQTMNEVPYMSKRFAMKRFLGLSQEEITENERLWKEENRDISGFEEPASSEMRGAGITPGGIEDAMAPPEEEMPADGAMAPPGAESPAAGPSGVPTPAAPA
jgi:Bacteriophage T4-like portal protein (Gp20)